jgi:hypothetical protein
MKNFKLFLIVIWLMSLHIFCVKEQPIEPDSIRPKHPFRSEPKENLSMNDVIAMIEKFDFFDRVLNPDSKEGFVNEYEAVTTTTGDQVVIDHASNLMWQYRGSGDPDQVLIYGGGYASTTVNGYLYALNESLHAGYDDWRLPTLEEGMSLLEPDQAPVVMHEYPFTISYTSPLFFGLSHIWTADRFSPKEAWVVCFVAGKCDYWDSYIDDGGCGAARVRAVRTIE